MDREDGSAVGEGVSRSTTSGSRDNHHPRSDPERYTPCTDDSLFLRSVSEVRSPPESISAGSARLRRTHHLNQQPLGVRTSSALIT